MDAVSLAHSNSLVGHPSVVLTDSFSLDSHSFLNGAYSSRISPLLSSSETITSSQNKSAGNDLMKGDRARAALYKPKSSDIIRGISRQANVLLGHDGNDQIWGGKKNDVLNGGADRDDLIGDRGNDFLVGGSGNDRLLGGQGSDTLKGESGTDWLTGGAGDDDLDGGAGLDRLNGGSGNDRLMDYEGGDRLTGGSGADQFGVGSPLTTKASIVTDFKPGTDQLNILRLGAVFKNLTVQERNDGILVLDQGQAIALLLGVRGDRLKADSFRFGQAQLADTLQKSLNQALTENPQATGLTATVFAPDGTLWQGFAGVSDRKTQTPITADSLFGIGSITKPIVATAILQLQEEGQLTLNDTLRQWLPELANNIPNSDRITVQQLLGHTSGIRDYTSEPDLIQRFFNDPSALSQQYTSEELLSFIEGKPALGEPGQEFFYSNSNYLLLGEIVEKVTGSTLATQLHQRFFKPLGMEQTFYAPQEKISKRNLTHSYVDLDEDGQLDDLNEGLSWTSAAGGVVSTAADIAKFSQALFEGELLVPATLQKMISESSNIGLGDLKNSRYGLGVEAGSVPKLGEFWGHNGATVGWQSEMAYLPDRQISAIVLATASESSGADFAIKIILENLQNTVQFYPKKSRSVLSDRFRG
ncbi:MAG: serine hydrolase [Leptolyngbyaceae cyanobacterium CSU_1_4]|nr:serine hydrolase [Leptolyngbyaceae cyanobacterium CSU_1_4]